jgi:hypothetical protein
MANGVNTDYTKKMQDYLASGGRTSDPQYNAYEAARKVKVTNATPQQLEQWGVSTPQHTLGAAAGATAGFEIGTGQTGLTAETDPMAEFKAYQDALIAARRASIIAGLDTAKNNALGNLANEEAGLAPQYYNKRNQAGAQSDVGAMNFAQYMGSRGVKGSAGALPEIYRNNALQNQVGALNQQEQAQRDMIARDRTEIQNNYQSDVAAANADLEAQGLQNYINQMNTNRQFGLQEAGLTGIYNGQPTLERQQFLSDEDYRNRTFDYQVEQDGIAQAYRISRDQVLDAQWLKNFNYNTQQDILNRALQARQISNDEYQAQTSRMNADWAQNPANPDNQTQPNTATTNTVDDYAATINSQWVPNGSNGMTSINTTAIKSYIDSLIRSGVDPAITDALAARYGIQ